MNVSCSAKVNACPLLLSSACVFYEGENLIYIGVNMNDSLQTALEKLNIAFSDNTLSISVISPLQVTPGQNPVISILQSSASSNGYLSSTDWVTFNSKQNQLNGTGFVKANGTIITYDNSTYYLASNPSAFIPLTAISSTATGLTYTNTTGVFSLTAGYLIPTIASYNNVNWDTAYTNRITSLTTTGSSGASTLLSNVLNVPNYTLSGLGGVPSTRTLTINGTTQDLSADRTFTIATANIYTDNGTLTSARTLTSGGFPLTFTGSNTAASLIARGLNLTHTLVASANSDVLVGLDINPTFTNTGFTGVTNYGLRVNDNLLIQKNFNGRTSIELSNTNGLSDSEAILILKSDVTSGSVSISKSSSTKGSYKMILPKDFTFYNSTDGDISILNDAAGKIKFAAGGSSTAQMTLTSAGRLLLGTTSESTNILEVVGTARISSNLTLTSLTAGSIPFIGASGLISQNNSNLFWDNGNARLGIGTATPSYDIHIEKNRNAVTTISVSNTTSGTNSYAGVFLISDTNSGSFTMFKASTLYTTYKTIVAKDAGYYNAEGGDFSFLNDHATGKFKWAMGASSTAQMTLTAAGRLLLGTTTESTNILEVAGSGRVTGNLYFGSAGSYLFGDTNNVRIYDKNNQIILQAFPSGVLDNRVSLNASGNSLYTGTSNGGFSMNDANVGGSQTETFIIKRGYFANVAATTKNIFKVQTQYYSNITNGTILRGVFVDIDDTTTYTGFSDVRAFESLKGGGYFNTSSVNASAILQADSTTKGFLGPRMTLTQRDAIATPAAGLQVYNTTGNTLDFYNGTSWSTVSSGNIYTVDGTLTGNRTVNLGSSILAFNGGNGVRIANSSTAAFGNQGSLMIGNPANNGALSFSLSTIYFNGVNGYHFSIATGLNDVTPTTFFQVKNSGNVIVNPTTDTGEKFQVNGTARVSGALTGGDGSALNNIIFDGGGTKRIRPNNNTLDITDSSGNVGFQVGNTYPRISPASNGFQFVSDLGSVIWSSPSNQVTTLSLSGAYVGHLDPFVDIVAAGYAANATNKNATLRIYTTDTTSGVYGNIILSHNGTSKTGNILIGGTTNNASAIVNIQSTTQGFLPPRLTTTQKNAIATPAAGLIVYDSTTNVPNYYNGTVWVGLGTGGGGTGTVTSIATTGPITGGTITTSGTIGITQSTTSTDGYLSSIDWNTFNGKQPQLNGTGFVVATGTTITYDNSTYYLASNPSGFVSSNIYTANGTLSGNRTVTMGVFTLSFEKDVSVNGLTIGKGNNSVATNTVLGVGAGSTIAAATRSVFIGYEAGKNVTTGASYTGSVLIGYQAGLNMSTGYWNVMIGDWAGRDLTTGTRNTLVGEASGYKITTASGNTIIGDGAGIGITTGGNNTILGVNSAQSITTGTYNIVLGSASSIITTGNYNTFIGSSLSGISPTLSNNIILADGQGNMRLVVDNSGNVSIGGSTAYPTFSGSKLDVNGTVNVTGNVGIGGVPVAISSLQVITPNQWSGSFVGNLNGARTPSQTYGIHLGWNYTGGSGESNIIWGTATGSTVPFPYLVFSTWDGTTKTDRVEFQDTGKVVFKNYQTTSSFTGTPVGHLAFDGSGNILTVAVPTYTNIYNSNGSLTSDRTVTIGDYSLVLSKTQTALDGANTFAGTSIVAAPTTNAGITWSSLEGFFNYQGIFSPTFGGSITFQNSNYASQELKVNRITFASASSTVTMTPAGSGSIRAFSNAIVHNYIDGTNNGTITHMANIAMYGDFASSSARFNVTNRYGLLINDFQEYGQGHTYTKRWAIYQAGLNDNNYFAGKVVIGNDDTVGVSVLNVRGLPTSATGLSTGDIWNNGGVLNIV